MTSYDKRQKFLLSMSVLGLFGFISLFKEHPSCGIFSLLAGIAFFLFFFFMLGRK